MGCEKRESAHTDKILIQLGKRRPEVKGIPKGDIILFLAKISDEKGYCVIYGPSKTCLSDNWNFTKLLDAKVVVGHSGQPIEPFKVKQGHIYSDGGGLVEWDESQKPTTKNEVRFRPKGNANKSTYKGRAVEKVYVVR